MTAGHLAFFVLTRALAHGTKFVVHPSLFDICISWHHSSRSVPPAINTDLGNGPWPRDRNRHLPLNGLRMAVDGDCLFFWFVSKSCTRNSLNSLPVRLENERRVDHTQQKVARHLWLFPNSGSHTFHGSLAVLSWSKWRQFQISTKTL